MREQISILNPAQERSTFDVRFARCTKLLAFTASRVLGGDDGVELVVRNCRVTAALDLPHFEREGAFRSWLLRVLINEALVVLRAKEAERQPWKLAVRRKAYRPISNQVTLIPR